MRSISISIEFLNSLWKGSSVVKTWDHHFHVLLNAVQPDNVDKVEGGDRNYGACQSYGDAARACLAQSLHGRSWGSWGLGCSIFIIYSRKLNCAHKFFLTWFIVRRLGMEVEALQGKIFLLESRGDGGQANATESLRPDPAAASFRE